MCPLAVLNPAALKTAALDTPLAIPSRRVPGWLAGWLAGALITLAVIAAARSGYYTPASTLGYDMGVAGTALMVLLMLYPLSKRLFALQKLIPIRHWFALHMACGVVGPVLILLHCTLRIHSLNAAVAFWSMVVVATSGVFGRFLYRRLHEGMYGGQRTFADVSSAADRLLEGAVRTLNPAPQLLAEMRTFAIYAESVAHASWRRPFALWGLGYAAQQSAARCRRQIGNYATGDKRHIAIEVTIVEYLEAIRDAAQFKAFERVFGLWHALHIPLVALLAVSAIVHVIAVHMY